MGASEKALQRKEKKAGKVGRKSGWLVSGPVRRCRSGGKLAILASQWGLFKTKGTGRGQFREGGVT